MGRRDADRLRVTFLKNSPGPPTSTSESSWPCASYQSRVVALRFHEPHREGSDFLSDKRFDPFTCYTVTATL